MKTSVAMNQLAMLTTVRDFELLELGLLKALEDMLRLRSIRFLSLNEYENRYELRGYVRSPEGESVECSESGALNPLPDSIGPDVWGAIEQARDSRRWVAVMDNPDCSTVYPLMAKEMILGFVLVNETTQPTAFEYQLIEGLLKVFHNYYTLLDESQRDKLTGLLNRKTFDEKIGRILGVITDDMESFLGSGERRQKRDGPKTYWLAVMDIDHFKRVNDTFGHIYGDEVLLLVSQIMKRTFRASDLLFRFGGEEFIMVVAADKQEDARRALERFRIAVEEYDFPKVGKVTVSIGAVSVGKEIIPAEIVGHADQALYFAKRNGRNQLAFFEELVASGAIQTPTEAKGTVDLF